MDVFGGLLLFAALVAMLWLAGELMERRRERQARAHRRVQVRKADRWWHDQEGVDALVAMRRVVDGGEAKP